MNKLRKSYVKSNLLNEIPRAGLTFSPLGIQVGIQDGADILMYDGIGWMVDGWMAAWMDE